MPKYQFEGKVIRFFSDEVEADSLDDAREIVYSEAPWGDFEEDMNPEVEIDWISELED